ncbi:hypothetical protein GCM10025868_20870 [Angustibacter aerolatus]|uniref:DeoR-like transcriptional repressor C-terminal sensor domain-containing protein n=1 Tax=Angustibacter aerolatus TaxID=1162965 RepID=A0ABQ6JJ00_9ACTN|nr:hypothetical protein GCM10025868_20870 [Angustibacter aerolatus]
MAEALPADRPITVLTASVPLAAAISGQPHLTVILLGGRVRPNTLAVVGASVTAMLGRYVVDLAILGANGISLTHGLTTPDPAVADVKTQAIRSSRRRVLVGVHSKFGISAFCRFGEPARPRDRDHRRRPAPGPGAPLPGPGAARHPRLTLNR